MALFDGKTALVTGGASGIGRSAGFLYAQNGAKVVISDVDEERGKETAQEIRAAGGETIFVRADVSRPEDCQSLVDASVRQFDHLDIAFNNAGVGGESNPVADYSVEVWQRVIAITRFPHEPPEGAAPSGDHIRLRRDLGQR